jgi:hypothetical protein
MDILSPEILDKLLAMPVLLVVIYVLWNNHKTITNLIDLIKSEKKDKG